MTTVDFVCLWIGRGVLACWAFGVVLLIYFCWRTRP